MVQSRNAKCFLKPSLLLFGLNDWMLFPFLFTPIYWRHPIFNCGIIMSLLMLMNMLDSCKTQVNRGKREVSRDTKICRPEGNWFFFARFNRCLFFFEIWRVRFNKGNSVSICRYLLMAWTNWPLHSYIPVELVNQQIIDAAIVDLLIVSCFSCVVILRCRCQAYLKSEAEFVHWDIVAYVGCKVFANKDANHQWDPHLL